MKKYKLMSPVLAAATVMAPASCITSCSNEYDEIASFVQEGILDTFADFSYGDTETSHKPCHRRTFACEDIYTYIKQKMLANGYKSPSGYDVWTNLPEVQEEQTKIGSQDQKYGNIWYDIEPTPGCERWTPIMLQSHFDMTLQFDSSKPEAEQYWQRYGVEYKIDYENETISVESRNSGGPGKNYMSLGADGGIGIAFMLTLARGNINSLFKHGPIRLMFTADEGGPTKHFQTGAHLLVADQTTDLVQDDWYCWEDPSSHQPIKIMSRHESERPFEHEIEKTGEKVTYENIISVAALNSKYIYQSAAGIHECVLSDSFSADASEPIVHVVNRGQGEGKKNFYKLSVSGLYGGHSAEDINDGIANALDLLDGVLNESGDKTIEIISVSSGNNPYRIPSEADVVFATTKDLSSWEDVCVAKQFEFRQKWKVDGNRININVVDYPESVLEALAIDNKHSMQLIKFISQIDYGPMWWYDPEHKEVATSVNFCPLTVKPGPSNSVSFEFHITCRSGWQEDLEDFAEKIHGLIEKDIPWLKDSRFDVEADVWEKADDNPLVDILFEGYRANKVNAELKNCHGWFEIACLTGAFESNNPNLACVGPTIYDAHTNYETLYFDSTIPFIKGILYAFAHANNL